MKRIRILVTSVAIAAITVIVVTFAINQKSNYEVKKMQQHELKNEEETYQIALDKALEVIDIPEGYHFKEVRSGKQNDVDVFVFRYEKENLDNNGLGGEHYSFTVEQESHKIIGITWMDQRFASNQQLPSEKRTEEIVQVFLNKVQSGLFDQLENQWIRPHDEDIKVNKEALTLTGMKYKCYVPENDSWAWVIVGPDGNIMAFEQDIKWKGGRITEKWLHDSWLLEHQL
ncbi:hypothetical protein [Lysinibacillus sp. RS5]|uniref:hypothetical protein n=1 Tax=unclassified Lysinibacillus TaxID=2636778 RepID=UPI0035BE2038